MVAKKRKHSSPSKREKSTPTAVEPRRGTKRVETSGSGIHQLTVYGVIILVIAIISALVLNDSNERKKEQQEDDTYYNVVNASLSVEESFATFLKPVCAGNSTDGNEREEHSTKAWCGNGKIQATGRTFQASDLPTRTVRRGDTLVEIPKDLQIWEVDALMSDFIRSKNLMKARHELTENPLPGAAFLAAYIAHERQRLEKESEENIERGDQIDYFRRLYLRSLPTWEDLNEFHPLLKTKADLQEMLGPHSWNFAVVGMYQEMINSEYKALVSVSPIRFGEKISFREYQQARIHVLSRSFSPGPEACMNALNAAFSSGEIQDMKSDWGMDSSDALFGQGCHAMVPILDMLDSHPQPNAVYKYDLQKEAFVISAKKRISPKWELMNSYGAYTDAHLYAKFGFVNGDGSGHTQASIALFHRPLDVQNNHEFSLMPHTITDDRSKGDDESVPLMKKLPEFQKEELKRYLTYDDGYADCVQKDLHPEAFELKRLKWMHLAKIANTPNSWVVTLQPRVPNSRPKQSSNELISVPPPQFDPKNIRMRLTDLMNTCRLISLSVEDFDGKSFEILKENVHNHTFVLPKGNSALEYRSLMLMARLSATAVMQYHPLTVQQEFNNVFELNKANAVGKNTWTAAHLRLGEMQSLQVVSSTAMSLAQNLVKDMDRTELPTPYHIREQSCPKEFTTIIDEIIS